MSVSFFAKCEVYVDGSTSSCSFSGDLMYSYMLSLTVRQADTYPIPKNR